MMKLSNAAYLVIGIFSFACAPSSGPGASSAESPQGRMRGESLPPSAVAQSSSSQSEGRGAVSPGSHLPAQAQERPTPAQSETVNSSATKPKQVLPERRALPSGTKVLHVGDSFAGALGIPLGQLLEARDIKSVLKHTDASYLTDWAWDGQLQKYLWRYNPDLVIVTLGANELGIADPERRIKTIRKITDTIGDRPCVWVGIPLWGGDQNGLMDVIKDHAAPCVYWDSNQLLDVEGMPRIADGIHPTSAARQDWAETLMAWFEHHVDSQPDRPWSIAP